LSQRHIFFRKARKGSEVVPQGLGNTRTKIFPVGSLFPTHTNTCKRSKIYPAWYRSNIVVYVKHSKYLEKLVKGRMYRAIPGKGSQLSSVSVMREIPKCTDLGV